MSFSFRKQFAKELSKRKFAGVLMSQHNEQADAINVDNSAGTAQMLNIESSISPTLSANSSTTIDDALKSVQQTTILTSSGTMTITSTTTPIIPHTIMDSSQNKITISPVNPIASIEVQTGMCLPINQKKKTMKFIISFCTVYISADSNIIDSKHFIVAI